MIKNWILKLVGKKIGDKITFSKTKLTAIVTVLVTAVQVLGPAFGHPIVIPPEVFKLLAAIGVWSLRDAMTTETENTEVK